MIPYKARGIVLHTVKYGDSGLVVYLYTDVHGRQSYLVQGVRSARSKGNKAAMLQPMFVLDFEGVVPRRGELHRMKDVAAAFPLSNLPFEVRKSTIALFMAETLYRLVRESEPNPALFAFVEQAVRALDVMQEGVANFHLWFLAKLSYLLGYYPGNVWTGIDREEAQLLETLMDTPVSELGAIPLNRTQRAAFLSALLTFIGYHTDTIREVRSVEILREVF